MEQALDGMGAYYYRDAQAGNLEGLADRARQVLPSLVFWQELSALSDRDEAAGTKHWSGRPSDRSERITLASGDDAPASSPFCKSSSISRPW